MRVFELDFGFVKSIENRIMLQNVIPNVLISQINFVIRDPLSWESIIMTYVNKIKMLQKINLLQIQEVRLIVYSFEAEGNILV